MTIDRFVEVLEELLAPFAKLEPEVAKVLMERAIQALEGSRKGGMPIFVDIVSCPSRTNNQGVCNAAALATATLCSYYWYIRTA